MTFSITARCENTNQLGIAISTAIPAVGGLCTYAQAGVGAIASQSFINPYIGINGLKYLAQGHSAEQVLERVLAEDPVPDMRQVAIVDKKGGAAAFTGEQCNTEKGHITAHNVAVAGNMIVSEETIQAMKKTFDLAASESLAERLLQALEAGQGAGGDRRGKQSAALLVVDTEEYPLVDLRVDEHANPVTELRRVFTVAEKELFPFVSMMPTKKYPGGRVNIEQLRKQDLVEDIEE